MKIFGFTQVDGRAELLLKGDSALLPNRKPFFMPDDATIKAYPCVVYRISRLGKNIAPRFAHRYFDAYAAGLHIEDTQALQTARAEGRPWTTAIAIDGSLPVGTMLPLKEDAAVPTLLFHCAEELIEVGSTLLPVEEAIAEVSRFITIKQGDYLFLPAATNAAFTPREEDYVSVTIDEEENLFCKFK